MRKLLSLIAALLLAGLTAAWADPANPDPIKMKQPDGSTITLCLHGDEYYSWYTSEDGKTLYKKDASGWWRPAGKPTLNQREISEAKLLRAKRDELFKPRSKDGLGLGWGSNHFIVILVEWADYKFQDGAGDYFTRMLNQNGFSDNGCVGSAKDYYTDASYGDFTPSFDVYGPVTLSRNHTDWPEGDNPEKHYDMARVSLKEAIDILDPTVDFSQYDNNNDGLVDNVYMFYPGYAASNGAENAIWPHSSSITKSTGDGVTFRSYACSSELRGTSGTAKNGCGTFCHEFGHVIGLPDLYDTDYGTHGSARHPSSWNLMAGGNHNSNGRIPARMSSIERQILGYLTNEDIVDLSTAGSKTIGNLSSKKFYKLPVASNEGEFFLAEVRDGQVWDSPLPKGLLIYHIDQSQNVIDNMTAAQRWSNWKLINGYEEHPCDYLLCPDESAYGGSAKDYYELWTFPSDDYGGQYYNVTTYYPTAWDGSQPYALTHIAYSNGQASFTVSEGKRTLSGIIKSAHDGSVIPNAIVVASKPASNSMLRHISLSAARQRAVHETTSDGNGVYTIELDDNDPETLEVYVFATGFVSTMETATGRIMHKDFSLAPVIKTPLANTYSKANLPITQASRWGYNQSGVSYTVAQHYTAEELQEHVGKTISSIAFSANAAEQEVYVFVDFGTTQRAVMQRAWSINATLYTTPNNSVDISSSGITIPANTDMYIGYTINNCTEGYPVYLDYSTANDGGFYFKKAFTTEAGGNWINAKEEWSYDKYNAMVSFTLLSTTSIDDNAKLTDLGLCYINIPETLTAGQTLNLKTVNSRTRTPVETWWYIDGKQQSSTSVILTNGNHTIKAELSFMDGTRDTVEATITVN